MLRLLAVIAAATPLATGATPTPAGSSPGVATCADAVLGNPDVPDGPIEFFEYRGWGETAVKGSGRSWTVKMGAAVAGDQSVTVTVVPRDQHRARLDYGDGPPRRAVRFEPCRDHARSTGWAGGVRLTELRRFTVEVKLKGEPPFREVLLNLPRKLSG
jgi:hypothetical protein